MFLRGGGTWKKSSSSHQGEASFFPTRQVLITGGARSGKSRFALSLAGQLDYPKRLFVATAVGCDAQMRAKIARHQKERDGLWTTLEEPLRLPERLPRRLVPGQLILFDCLPTFLTNLLLAGLSTQEIRQKILKLLGLLRRPGLCSIFVTNEVGMGLVPDHPLGREFRDLLGEMNQQVASSSDEVYLLVAGLPMRLKGPHHPTYPPKADLSEKAGPVGQSRVVGG